LGCPLLSDAVVPEYAFSLPLFLPMRTSRRLAQQQHSPICTSHAKIANALAVHMKPKRYEPILALMFNSWTPLITFRNMTNMTVAMTDAAVAKRALRNARMAMGKVHHREKMLMGMRNMRTNERQADVRNSPNIQCEASLIRSRISLIFEGRFTEATKSISIPQTPCMKLTGCSSQELAL
jgi:hypothetical protein